MSCIRTCAIFKVLEYVLRLEIIKTKTVLEYAESWQIEEHVFTMLLNPHYFEYSIPQNVAYVFFFAPRLMTDTELKAIGIMLCMSDFFLLRGEEGCNFQDIFILDW